MTVETRPLVVVMGVSASGKSTVARLLAANLKVDFIDADDLHSVSSLAKMIAGVPLTDEDRLPWLDRVGKKLALCGTSGGVVACSALRRVYRDRIRSYVPEAAFVHLHGSEPLLASRAGGRTDHFMPSSLLRSQLETLEALASDEFGQTFDVSVTAEVIALAAADWLRSQGRG